MKDWKNIVSNIFAWLSGVAIAVGTFAVSMGLPMWVTSVCALVVGIAATTNLVLTGKNADLSKKTPNQLVIANEEKGTSLQNAIIEEKNETTIKTP